MTSSQFSEWQRYNEMEPFGQPWDNWLMAQQLSFQHKIWMKKGTAPAFEKLFFKNKLTQVREGENKLQAMFKALSKKGKR